jgi:hypothetical protein
VSTNNSKISKIVVDREAYSCYTVFTRSTNKHATGGELMPETIVDILNKIADAKGQDYAKGFVDGVNLMTPDAEEENQPG